MLIDVRAVPPEVATNGITFTGAEFMLNSFLAKDTAQINQPFGRLYYDVRKKMMEFEAAQIKSKSGLFTKRDEPNVAVSLMKRAVLKNKDNVTTQQKTTLKNVQAKKWKSMQKPITTDDEVEYDLSRDTIIRQNTSKFKLASNKGIDTFSENYLKSRESEIEEARKQLQEDKANAKTAEDSLLIKDREELLNAAVVELSGARKLIQMQKDQISTQRNLLVLAIISVVFLFSFLYILYKHFKQKKTNYILLQEKNKKITDSINYAKYIQQSILPLESEIKKLFPKSFIYYEPRDIVSGDFYWITELKNKAIVAAVDCTGHGVPGAFMSLIGNILLNEIINEKGIVEPATILKMLHKDILKSLHQNAGDINCQDGMEMSLCIIDYQSKVIEFAGAMNPVYIVKDKTINIVKPDAQAIGGISSVTRRNSEMEFTTQRIPIVENMSMYMFTDGYMDQFGGPENKKFNITRFKTMLLEIEFQNMDDQKKIIEQTMLDWKGEKRQIDDMLVIGLKF